MKGTPAIYLGRIVDKTKFRTFVYGTNGEKKLVESWDEYEAAMESGLWFPTELSAIESKICREAVESKPFLSAPKPRSRTKPKPAPVVEEDADDVLPDDGSVFEVKDDFLPKESE